MANNIWLELSLVNYQILPFNEIHAFIIKIYENKIKCKREM